jgi:hypothetical protein
MQQQLWGGALLPPLLLLLLPLLHCNCLRHAAHHMTLKMCTDSYTHFVC